MLPALAAMGGEFVFQFCAEATGKGLNMSWLVQTRQGMPSVETTRTRWAMKGVVQEKARMDCLLKVTPEPTSTRV